MLSQATHFTNARRFAATLLATGAGCIGLAAILVITAWVLRARTDVALLDLIAASLLIAASGLLASGAMCAGRRRLLEAEERERAASDSSPVRPRKLFSGEDPQAPSSEIVDASRHLMRLSGWAQAVLVGLLAGAAGGIVLFGWPTQPIQGDAEPLLVCSAVTFAVAFPFLILERLYANTAAAALPEAERLARLLRVPLLALVGGGVSVAVAAAGFGWSLWIERVIGAVVMIVAAELLGRAIAGVFVPLPSVETARAIPDSTFAGWIRFAVPSLQSVSAAARTQLGIDLSRSWALLFMRRAALPVAAAIAITGWLLTGVSTLAIDERGIYERLGVPVEVLRPGLHVRLPWPLGTVRRLENGVIHEVAIAGDQGEDDDEAESEPTPDAESDPPRSADRLWDAPHPSELTYLLASADNGRQGFQTVNIDIRFTYRIGLTDEAAMHAAYRVDAPETLVRAAASRLLARYFAVRTLSAVLRDDRETIAGDIRSALQRQLDDASSGIEMLQVVIEAIHPPTGTAHAYHSVQAAEINARTAVAREKGNAVRAGKLAAQQTASVASGAQAAAAEAVQAARHDATLFHADAAADRASGRAFLFERWLERLSHSLGKAQIVLLDHRLTGLDTPAIDLRSFTPSITKPRDQEQGSPR
jgi:regulator of protease activity HflC (stomatin/prohibitin superfamily)